MAIAIEVARVEGAMLAYGWKSRYGPYPEGYTEEYFRQCRKEFTLSTMLADTKAYSARIRTESLERLKKHTP